MTCKECIYEKVCIGCALGGFWNAEKDCKNFKDRSKFVELPCKVGDTVYQIVPINLAGEWEIQQYKVQNIIFDTNGVAFDIGAIGKQFFLTCEEAEQAIKEKNEK